MRKGLTLIEVLITVAVIAIIAPLAISSLFNYRRLQDLDSDVRSAVAFLRDAQQRAITQEQEMPWGVHFENPSTGSDFYQLFQGDSFVAGTALTKAVLRSPVDFQAPGSGAFLDVVFSQLTGTPTSTKIVTLKLAAADCVADPNSCQTITINPNGSITY